MTPQPTTIELQVERVGRAIKNETWNLTIEPHSPQDRLYLIAQGIHRRARPHLLSRDVDVTVYGPRETTNPTNGTFTITVGDRVGGFGAWNLTAEETTECP